MTDIKETSAVKIQNFYRKYKFFKTVKLFFDLNLLILSSTLTFNEFKKVMFNKEILNTTNDMIKQLKYIYKNNNITNRMIISSYMITGFHQELFDEDKHPIDKIIYDWSIQLHKVFQECYLTRNIHIINVYLDNYYNIFNEWKKVDKDRMTEIAIISFYNNKNKKNHQVCKEIIKDLRIINKDIDIKDFIKNYKEYYETIINGYNELNLSITKNFKKAFYDSIVYDLHNNNITSIYNLINETNERIKFFIPDNKKNEFETITNNDNIQNMLQHNSWTTELQTYILFITKFIIDLLNDIDNYKWCEHIINKINDDYEQNLPLIIIEINEKIDDLIQLIL